ncbi:hypothetical protein ACSSS7_003705 [Eimeria intestinalis]
MPSQTCFLFHALLGILAVLLRDNNESSRESAAALGAPGGPPRAAGGIMSRISSNCSVTFHCRCSDTSPGPSRSHPRPAATAATAAETAAETAAATAALAATAAPAKTGAPATQQQQQQHQQQRQFGSVRLSTTAATFPLWSSAAVALPCGVDIRYKYLIARQCTCSNSSGSSSSSSSSSNSSIGGGGRGKDGGAAAAGPAAPCRCSSSSSACRWENISGHDDQGNRIVRINGGSHDLFDKFGQCDLPPLSAGLPPQSVCLTGASAEAAKGGVPWDQEEKQQSSRDSAASVSPTRSREASTAVGELRQTMERSHSQLLQQVVDARTGEKQGEALVAEAAATAAAAKAVAVASDAIQQVVETASKAAAEEVSRKARLAVEAAVQECIKQLAVDALSGSVAAALSRLDEAAERLLANASRRSTISGGASSSMSGVAARLQSSGSTSASTADASVVLAEAEESEVQQPMHTGSRRRSRSADIELRSSKDRLSNVDMQKPLSVVPHDFGAPTGACSSPAPSEIAEAAALTSSKDLETDLSWIHFTLHSIRRENTNIRQMLGLICHSLDAALNSKTARGFRADAVEGEERDTTTFSISTPVGISRQSSSASLFNESEEGGAATTSCLDTPNPGDTPPGNQQPPLLSPVRTSRPPASPRGVVETESICMAKSLEKFNSRNHYFPNVYTATGNQNWEHYISTNKGLSKGSGS